MTSIARQYAQRNTDLIDLEPVAKTVEAYDYAYYSLAIRPTTNIQTYVVDLADLNPSRVIAVRDVSGNSIGESNNYYRFFLDLPENSAKEYPGVQFTVVFNSLPSDSFIQMIDIPIHQEFHISPKTSGSVSVTYRSDGTSFNLTSSSPTLVPHAEFWLAGGDSYDGNDGITIAHSYDGVTWAYSNPTPLRQFCKAIAYNGKMWVAGGTSIPLLNPLIYSYDGITWLPSANGGDIFPPGDYDSPDYTYNDGGCSSVAWNGSMWTAVGGGDQPLAYSYDGITWVASEDTDTFGDEGYDTAVVWNGTMWLAGACNSGVDQNSLAYSIDGTYWVRNNQPFGTNKIYAIAWNGSLWVIGSGSYATANNRLGWSTDGITWTQSTNGANLMLRIRSIAWNGSLWVAGGDGVSANQYNPLIYSADGKYWFLSENGVDAFRSNGGGTPNGCYSVTWNGSLWVASGASQGLEYGWIVYSKDGIHWTPANNSPKNSENNYLFEYYGFTIATRGALPYN